MSDLKMLYDKMKSAVKILGEIETGLDGIADENEDIDKDEMWDLGATINSCVEALESAIEDVKAEITRYKPSEVEVNATVANIERNEFYANYVDGKALQEARKILISDDERTAYYANGQEDTEVFDQIAKKKIIIRRADCGAGCKCAMEILTIK